MGNINKGTQQISFRWKHPAKAQDFNHLLNGGIKPGLCNALQLTNVDNVITFPQFNIFIEPTDDSTSLIHIETTGQFAEEFTPASDLDYIYCSFTQAEEIDNYLDFNVISVAGSSGIIPSNNKIVLGTATSISGIIQSISTSGQTKSLWDEDWNARFEQDIYCNGNIQGGVPVGTIIAWSPGYYGAAGNGGGFTPVSITLPDWWKECDGTELNDPNSPIFDGAGRFLFDLTDNRFLMGDIAGNMGDTGGDNAMAHTHSAPAHYHGMGTGADLNIVASGNHYHYEFYEASGGVDLTESNYPVETRSNGNWLDYAIIGYSSVPNVGRSSPETHTHDSGDFAGRIGLVTGGVNGNALMTSGAASNDENRPLFLSTRYIMRIK